MENILELKGISKVFPGVRALDGVCFDLRKGEIHALMGENGAGKSTFIKVITGVNIPEEGDIILNGEKVYFSRPLDATKRGIAAIYQHATSYLSLSVTENIFIGHELTNKLGWMRWRRMRDRTKELLEMIGADIDPTDEMGLLSIAQQQMVEIAKALSQDANIIIMDEPTAALTMRETNELYSICKRLRENGKSIIFISHRLEDIYEIADRTTVLRDGKYIGTWNTAEMSRDTLVHAMVGREISAMFPEKTAQIGPPVFKAENLTRKGVFHDISFSVRKGEILAITGLVGSGRTELAEAIYGITRHDGGAIYVEEKATAIKSPVDAVKKGVLYLPEDRQHHGLVLKMDIGDNVVLSELKKYQKAFLWLDVKDARKCAAKLATRLMVKAQSVYERAESLSGGNQQKVVIAKLLNSDAKVLILDEPTKGIDVAAKSAIYGIVNDLAAKGYAIILISSEMEEVLGMADSVLVMNQGRVTGYFDNGQFDQMSLFRASMGLSKAE
jgi:rhamnose transport system ATP-binding protein